MITDSDRFSQDKSPYERPTFRYRCGRLSLWGKPCSQGPNTNGACGGTSECTPHLDNDRWECRRSPQSGGPCENGPLPDGQCCNQHPPCKPIPTLRGYRARLTMLAAVLVLALIGAFAMNGDGAGAISSISPGDLIDRHAQFTSGKGCIACHAPAGADAAEWIRAAWTPSSMTQSCVECHQFDGPATAPHNRVFPSTVNLPQPLAQTQCAVCHTEHKGTDADISQIADQQCSVCHQTKFASFSEGHPQFSKTYPSRRRTAIAFDHAVHINKYFEYPRFADVKPKQLCVACHDTSKATRNVPVRPFKETCAACHAQQIPKSDLVVFTLPEFEEDPFDAGAIGEVCGVTAELLDAAGEDADKLQEILENWRAGDPVPKEIAVRIAALRLKLGRIEGATAKLDDDEEYLSVSEETLPPIAVMLLGLDDGEDADSYSEAVRDLVMAMIEEGVEPLTAGVEGRPSAATLFSGLSPEVLRRAGCAWAANQENEPTAADDAGGWFADELSLRYRPLRHSDPVVKAWIELAAAGGDGVGDDLRGELFSRKKGPGSCAKCHSVNIDKGDSERLQIAWKYGPKSKQNRLRFLHRPHLNLLGPGQSCAVCHKINETAKYDAAFQQYDPTKFVSNFKSIDQKTCAACHAQGKVLQDAQVIAPLDDPEKAPQITQGKVRQNCSLCHQYHTGGTFKVPMTTAGRGPPK